MITEHLPSLGQIVLVLIAGWGTLLLTLATLWSTNPRASWPCRIAPIGLLLAVLMPMGLVGFVKVFIVQTVVVFGVLVTARAVCRWSTYRRPESGAETNIHDRSAAGPARLLPQFSLGQLFASLFVGGTILALILTAPVEEDVFDPAMFGGWVHVGLLGAALATATLLGWTLGAAGRWRFVMLAVAAIFLTAFLGQQSGLAASLAAQYEFSDRWLFASAWIVGLGLIVSCCLWLLALAGWNWWPRASVTRSPSKLARIVIVLVCLVPTLPTLDLGWAMVPPARSVSPEPPSPNGYLELLAVERDLKWDSVAQAAGEEPTAEQIAAFVADNELPLVALDAALKLPSQVPIDWRPGYEEPLSKLLDLYVALDYHAKASLATGSSGAAVNDYLNAFRTGNSCANGGTGANELIGNTIDMLSSERLAGLLDQLDEEQLSRVQLVVEQCLHGREAIEPIIDRTERHELITGGWIQRLSAWFVKRRLSDGWDAAVELPNHRAARDARLNLLILECALRRYHLKHDSYPAKLSDLVPIFIEKLPRDPFADAPFRYSRTAAGYLLYSINADRIDNGGEHGESRSIYEGDLLLRP